MTILSPFGPAGVTLVILIVGVYLLAVLEQVLQTGGRNVRVALTAPLVETLRLLRQQNLTPRGADRFLFATAPLIALATVALAALVLPIGPGLIGFDPSIGLFYFVVLLSPFVIAMMNAGWSQNAKVGLFGTFRAAAHLVSYEVPLGFASIGAPMAAQSLAIGRIVEAQTRLWFVVWQPLGLLIYLVAALMPAFHHPFDSPQAGSELEGGVLAEYTGARRWLFEVALKAMFLVMMGMGVELFFGGWQGPWLPAPLWFTLKTYLLAGTVLWLGRRVPRLRHDQMLGLAWKVLVPASLVNIALVGVLALYVVGGTS